MTSEPGQGDTMAAEIRYTMEPSSPLSSCPPSPSPPPPRKRSISPAPKDSLPDNEATKKLSNLELDGKNDSQPKKRTKLTPAEKAEREKEKEEKKREREEKEKEKARIKAEKDEQKRLRDEEKAKKDLEKAAEKAKRDEEKAKREEEKAKREGEKAKKDVERAKKEEEKAKKEEEKLKKERAQLRMDSFFRRAPPASASSSKAPQTTALEKTSDTPSVRPTTGPTTTDTDMIDSPVKRDDKSDYIKTFQPFFVRPGVTLASSKRTRGPEGTTEEGSQIMDRVLFKFATEFSDEMDIDDHPQPSNRIIVDSSIPERPSPSDFKVIFDFPPSKWKKGGVQKLSTKQILAGLDSSPVPDIFGARKADTTDYVAELRRLSRKILKYAEDVRPAYRGTYTKVPTTSGLRKGRNPFQKSLPGVDYDYDSEAEWVQEPDDDGEDIMSEDDEDPMETGSADEMDDFLDDEDEVVKKKANIAGPLIPAASGLMWDGECPRSDELMHYKIGVLIEGGTTPINPFSKEYWVKNKGKSVPQPKTGLVVPEKSGKEKNKIQETPHGGPSGATSHIPPPRPPAPQGGLTHPDMRCSFPTVQYGQNLVSPWNVLDRSPSAYMGGGKPRYSNIHYNPEARASVIKVEEEHGPIPLFALADHEFAHTTGISPRDQYTFFMYYHNIDYCNITHSEDLERCLAFIVGNDSTKVAMLEALKKMFPKVTKPMLKNFMDSFCARIGTPSDKKWRCVFRKNENSYWQLDPENCSLIPPKDPVSPNPNHLGKQPALKNYPYKVSSSHQPQQLAPNPGLPQAGPSQKSPLPSSAPFQTI
ncbi:hypothetical protein TWF481_004464 [Arthrobotrys musiformis]|uniref:Uncharacterized protein n=1 Tax=Arthrobotrys musiformis TaxID=47236 RepID=A0AAV9WJL3_9PEZI